MIQTSKTNENLSLQKKTTMRWIIVFNVVPRITEQITAALCFPGVGIVVDAVLLPRLQQSSKYSVNIFYNLEVHQNMQREI